MFYIWLGIIVLMVIIEAATINLVTIWFIASGIVALIVSFFTDNLFIQFGIFVLLGVLLLLTTRKPLMKIFKIKTTTESKDKIIGMIGKVTEQILPHEVGEVKVAGKNWSAVSDAKIEKGTMIKVIDIKGIKLKVEEEK